MTISITRAPADPVCPRISVGGNEAMGVYCVFRGPAADCIRILRSALDAMEVAKPTLDKLTPDQNYKELGAS